MRHISLTTLMIFSTFLVACGGGGGGGGNNNPPPANTHTVSVAETTGGSVTPGSANIASGQSAQFTLTPQTGYSIGSASGCGGSLTGNTYQTGPINAACTITVSFSLGLSDLHAPEEINLHPGDEQLTLTWDSVEGAGGYNLYYATQAGVTPANYANRSGGTRIENVDSPYLLTGLLNTNTYHLVVTAYDATGESAPSFEVSASPGPTELIVEVDTSIEPSQSTIEDAEGASSPVGRMVDVDGVATDFILDELVVYTDDETKVNALMARWSGTSLKKTTLSDGFATYRVKIDPSTADATAMISELNQLYPESLGLFQTSSEAAAKLLAIAFTEMHREQMSVFPNFVAAPQDIRDGSTTEALNAIHAGYSSNAFEWTYMNRGSAQDIGVGAAWQAMERGGRFSNKVSMMIMDGGFAPNADFPADRQIIGRGWNIPNAANCGGSPCPWHGTHVVTTAMGIPNNNFGVAGPAGPVGRLIAVQFSTNVADIIETLGGTINTLPQAKIINMSFSVELGVGWNVASRIFCPFCPHPSEILSGITRSIADSNKLIFASAGNDGRDVDERNRLGLEKSTTMPCELDGVICVGGMSHNATQKHNGSNFGSRRDNNSVDIYGPYTVWRGPDPDEPANEASRIDGTSFSSPFVAGVAALVWAADPSLTSQQVWTILRNTAHVGGVGVTGHQRRINAYGAIAEILGGEPPTVTLNAPATTPLNREWGVTAVVNDPEYGSSSCPTVACPLTWSPAPSRIVGNTAFYRFNTAGNTSVSVTAEDLIGQTASASRSVNVINSPPVVTLSQPTAGASIYVGQTVQLLGSATDINEGPDPGPGNLPCTWSSSNGSDAPFPVTGSCNRSVTFATTGTRTLTLSATDPQGLSSSTTVTITVSPAPDNLPPDISMGSLIPSTVNYNGDGYNWETNLTATASATDPEGNTPIRYIWRATSFVPNSTTIWRSDVVISDTNSGGTSNLNWTPSTHNPNSLLGSFAQLGNDCYFGQVVSLTLEARDSLENSNFMTLPNIKIYRCIFL